MGNDALTREHQGVGVVNFEQRFEEEALRVAKVVR
jgi:hypothetical protein